jgi:hypothetical protein
MEKVTITRLWHNPEIHVTVDSEKISLSMPLDDFVAAMITEIGSVAMVFKQKTFAEKVKIAKEAIIKGIKEESVKAI